MAGINKSGLFRRLNKQVLDGVVAQASTNAPTLTERSNTLGVTLTWGRSGAGEYAATSAGPICTDKANLDVIVGSPYAVNRVFTYDYTNSTPTATTNAVLKFSCRDLATPSAADLGTSVPITIIRWE